MLIETTYKFTGTLSDFDGNLRNPDGDAVTVKIYDQNNVVLKTGVGTKVSAAVYSYEYSPGANDVPTKVVFSGLFSGKPVSDSAAFTPRRL